jgi:metal-responsive CopG/Arc/MetJ family transcriptional regulator
MITLMGTGNVRLNYTISDSTSDSLANYCELTGRTASDLVRQIICEVLEEDRKLPLPEAVTGYLKSGARRDRRTDMWISSVSLVALDEKLEKEGHQSKSAVLSYLIDDFLSTRANHAAQEMVRVTTLVDRNTYTKLTQLASSRRQQVEELISGLCKDSADQLRGNTI